jgi:GT2 family glycosyltransferase
MNLSVIVPTYRRGPDLLRCVGALQRQTRPADEVIIVARDTDAETIQMITELGDPRIGLAIVRVPGVVAAMNIGLEQVKGDIVALTDDDAAPWPDWLERIEAMFAADSTVGGVGGKDWQYKGDPLQLDEGSEARSGEMQWWGRVIGDHHHATPGPPREVVVVKGVNCAYRTAVLRQVGGFDTQLQGTGAQVHWELSLGLSVLRAGWRIIFDPSLGVDHFPAPRFDEDRRGKFSAEAQRNMVYNETLVLCSHFRGLQKATFLAWSFLVGTRGAPGILQVVRLLILKQANVLDRWTATVSGRISGWRRTLSWSHNGIQSGGSIG